MVAVSYTHLDVYKRQVVQTGYKIGERVLRPALVGVSAGAPKAPDAPAGEPTQH